MQVFNQLNNTDMKFGAVKDDKGRLVELSHGNYLAFLSSPNRDVRANAFHAYYQPYVAHAHTLAATLNGWVQRNMYYAKARNYPSALEAALFPDQVPVSVYDNLLTSIHRQLPALYQFYDLRRRKMGLKEIHALRHLRADLVANTQPPYMGRGGQGHHGRAGAAGKRILRRAPARLGGPLVRPLREPRQAKRRLLGRLLRRQTLHPHQLPARRARFRLHAGPRGRPLDAQLLLRPRPSPTPTTNM